MTAEPIPFTTTRFRCPFCSRGNAKKSRCREHIARCWFNPESRGCKTCKHFEPAEPSGDYCFPGRPCNCNDGQEETCAVGINLRGDDSDVKPGPIVGCDKWQAVQPS